MAKGETYEEFVEKFKPKKTTDDCYTPPLVYEAVADWVVEEYGVNKESFCRPFYPGGDYENYNYDNKIVVDNPPFSILSQIVKFYTSRNIKYFLFCPYLTAARLGELGTLLIIDADVIYENGARVNTSFVTNLDDVNIRARTAPKLQKVVKNANKQNLQKLTKTLPKYKYPKNVMTTRDLGPLSRLGIDFAVTRDESVTIGALDCQKEKKKGIFGAGWLISDRLVKEREKAGWEKAEQEKAEVWELSEREKNIISELGKGGAKK